MTRTDYPLYGKPGVHVIQTVLTGRVCWAGVSHHKAAAAWNEAIERFGQAEAGVWHGESKTHTARILLGEDVASVREVKP